jgi:hypothetical protein
MVLTQVRNISALLSLVPSQNTMDTMIENRREERRRLFENILLEVMAALFVGTLSIICFWILFKF